VRRGRLAVAVIGSLLVGCGGQQSPRELVVGSQQDPESVVLAELYAGALRSFGTGARVESAGDPLTELDTGRYQVLPGLTGRLLQTFQPGATAMSEETVYRAMVAALPEGVAAGDYASSAQDTPTAAVTAATANTWGGRDLTALVRYCPQLIPGKVAGVAPPAKIGDCSPPPAIEFDSNQALFDALRNGRINAAWTTSADPGVPPDVVVLADGQPPLVLAENVVPLYRRNELDEREVLALDEVAGEFDTAALVQMRQQIAAGAEPRQVAEAWLAAHPLGH
jgi:glycine betaine/choline ABC-type transport system substrate-binding protein